MEFKEKIIQCWFIFILTFLGFSKFLIIVPVFVQLEINNYYLVGFISLVFWPVDYIVRVFEGFAEASGMLMFAAMILAIVRLILFTLESYILVFILFKIFFNKPFQARFKYLIGKKIFELKEKSSRLNIHSLEQHIEGAGRYLPFVVGFILIFSIVIGGYFIWENYNSVKAQPAATKAPINNAEKERDMRDNQRINDISSLSQILENYFNDNDQYPVAIVSEKISDETSGAFQLLKAENFLVNPLNDPLPDKYYYGYKSDGRNFELTAVLENKENKRCSIEGNICIYLYKNSNEKISEKPVVQNSSAVSNPCTPATVADIDGNIYNTVKIGSHCWMQENLKVTKNPQGKQIDRDCYNNDPDICETDGGLYTWLAAMNIIISDIPTFKSSIQAKEPAQGICPDGWHIPRDSEWSILENYLEENKAKTASGSFMLCSGVDGYWIDPCGSAGTKLRQGGSSGFDAVYAGSVENTHSPISLPNEFWYQEYLYKTNWEDTDSASKFSSRGEGAYFWSSTSLPPRIPRGYPNTRLYEAWFRKLSSAHGGTLKDDAVKNRGGMSVRCLKNY